MIDDLFDELTRNTPPLTAKEALLEVIESEDGTVILKEVGNDDALVSIQFAQQITQMVGKDAIRSITQSMIQAGIADFMYRQASHYHAHVYDKKPQHFS